ncbi:C2 domain and Phospholipase C, phosphatidylinositol-specific, X domain and Phosphoinositide phospholipase C family and Phospholipase C, phosphatidylinositol-specific, Y domain and EF-hand domain pair and Pleckstrin homology-like domain and Phospholipase C, phosphoinositol-specific, EF-hand-like domain and PLC-like phosphodiesterase, TIM beta/alpha-barrel domain-containing protein [Strongyloides ratti]|uniref:Phosphoinositide phospholipase C n=1 Tax=Strongyloides ratti TaxID=34506 RepID=A0A090LCT3_STRRB|nr:C2 domain and Phospholipase C, phosphatidylinositol-specific, X domain and Phosphoinositide phospholipase C family and Phospholipase C, phosphatidylinositol-specific, Y domain and EF-hand domain pair and Pleckstrin homology-like domain and Phospholipase C, phosphoinositol-specific, EF-hand-like domain and PLC-like phosphodiesterase, TIM beta/alpha-barrel domain-containing protein [Strongyloides ratti]CEF67572.1 C2 domain and Phospholipase C, phosphatidylinositol-specific, X domain and Phosphoin
MSQSAKTSFYNVSSVTSVSGFLSDKSSLNNSNCSQDSIQFNSNNCDKTLPSSSNISSMEGNPSPINKLDPFNNRPHLRSSLRHNTTRTSKSPGRKTVSFFSINSDKKVSNVNDCLQIMQNGTEMIKIRTHVRQFKRFFSLDTDCAYIRWQPSNKKPHKARLAVESIREIRVGRNTEYFRGLENQLQDIQDDCIFSIIHGDNYECLDLIALSAEDANIWVTGLLYLTSGPRIKCLTNNIIGPRCTLRERWLQSVFIKADENNIGFLTEKVTTKCIRMLNDKIALSRIKQKLKEVIVSQDEEFRGRISMGEFVDIYKDLATRPEIYFLMVRYANKDYLTVEDLQLFLETEQGVSEATNDMCEKIITKYEPSDEGRLNLLMTVDGFNNFLLSKESSVFDPGHLKICDEMDHPFNHYFIAASHNTYMVEDQLKGPSSVDGYISALKRGCRFIELDLWDPLDIEEDKQPMIHNGPISSCRLPLSSALQVIKELAFEASKYPLFIRLEIHMSLQWQQVAYNMITETLKNLIYKPTEDVRDWTDDKNVPSPHKFQNKILFIGKKFFNTSDVGEVSEEDEAEEMYQVTGNNKRSHKKKIYILKEFSDLIPDFLQSCFVTDSSLLSNNELDKKKHLISINEGDCLRIMQNYPSDLIQITKDFMVRVIPDPLRIDSSNMNPQEFWNFAVSLVSINYQTPGLHYDLQEGRFSSNGCCGYVLKPSTMREDLFAPNDRLSYCTQILHLRILSGQQLPRPRGSNVKSDSADPFVVVEVFGIPLDCAEERTKTVRNESANPNFDESLQFQINVPELALIRFLVLDDDFIGDDFIGQYTIPFECLQSGYRHIPLLNNEGDPIENCSLFVHIAITNRRGGGKAKKRGMSVKRKTAKVQTGMKLVGIKNVDELFKSAILPLIESIEMRNKMETALIEWQEQCGLSATGSIRQGLRLMHSRICSLNVSGSTGSPQPSTRLFYKDTNNMLKNHGNNISFYIQPTANGCPLIKRTGIIPDSLAKTFVLMECLFDKCSVILNKTESLLNKIEDATKKISECYEELPDLCAQAGLRSQKATRATENFAWNVRLLKSQLASMHKSQIEASDIFTQVFDTAKLLGILRTNEDETNDKDDIKKISTDLDEGINDVHL